MLHPELRAPDDSDSIIRDGRRLDHAEAASKPLLSHPEKQPRGAKVHGNRPIDQAEAAVRFIAAPEHEKMHDERLWDLRQKRDREMHGIPEWEELRSLASAIKEHTLAHLDEHLEQFEANARLNGVHVHSARDAAEHNRIVHGILEDHGAKSLIKSKSMLTEECGFRPYMASVGIGNMRALRLPARAFPLPYCVRSRDRSRRAHPATRQRRSEPRGGACRAQAQDRCR